MVSFSVLIFHYESSKLRLIVDNTIDRLYTKRKWDKPLYKKACPICERILG